MFKDSGIITVIAIIFVGMMAAMVIPAFIPETPQEMQIEAKQMLKKIYTMERSFRQEFLHYAHNGDSQGARGVFDSLGIDIPKNARYTYEITAAANTFEVKATANLDEDDILDIWYVDQTGALWNATNDVTE